MCTSNYLHLYTLRIPSHDYRNGYRDDGMRTHDPRDDIPRSRDPRDEIPRSHDPRNDIPRSRDPRDEIPRSRDPRDEIPRSRDPRDDMYSKVVREPRPKEGYKAYKIGKKMMTTDTSLIK